MATMTISETIRAPRAEVFERSVDVDRWAETITDITKIERLTEGPIGVGTRFRETRVMFGREATEEMEFVEFVDGSHYVLAAESHGMRYRSTMRFEDAPVDGATGTRVTFEFEGTPLTLGARVMGTIMRPMMRKAVCSAVAKDLRDLKAACEGAG